MRGLRRRRRFEIGCTARELLRTGTFGSRFSLSTLHTPRRDP